MRILVTGGAGFIGRWVVKQLLDEGYMISVIDNLSNSSEDNIREFLNLREFRFVRGDILDVGILDKQFKDGCDVVVHLAASINVQDSIDDPITTFRNDVMGTLNVLECCRKWGVPIVYTSTCLVYDRVGGKAIDEGYKTLPRSPYAAAKLSAEEFVVSYGHSYNLPYTILRPFNTYGPYQRFTGEGGVVATFIANALEGKPLTVYGDGNQTRDFLYVEDCARFINLSVFNEDARGKIINAGTGKETDVNKLARLVARDRVEIVHVEHIHPQAEVGRLRCDYSLATRLLGWKPEVAIDEGLDRTEKWMEKHLTLKRNRL